MSSGSICENVSIRKGVESDLSAIAEIQAESSEASHWLPSDYLQYEFLVAEASNQIAGFLVWRNLAPDECEILNLAVAPRLRRSGIARRLMFALMAGAYTEIYLEVRESNQGARAFYQAIGFKDLNTRPGYYTSPDETAIVMKFHSC